MEEQAKISLQVPRPVTEKTFARQELRQVSFRDPDRRIAALARLPDVIATSATTDELHSRLMNVLLSGIPLANSSPWCVVERSSAWKYCIGSTGVEPTGVFYQRKVSASGD